MHDLVNKATMQAHLFVKECVFEYIVKHGFTQKLTSMGVILTPRELLSVFDFGQALDRTISYLTELLLSKNQLLQAYSPLSVGENIDTALLFFAELRNSLDESTPIHQAVDEASNSVKLEAKIAFDCQDTLVYQGSGNRCEVPIPFAPLEIPLKWLLTPSRPETQCLVFLNLLGAAVAEASVVIGVLFGLLSYPDNVFLNPDSFFINRQPVANTAVTGSWQSCIQTAQECMKAIYTDSEPDNYNRETTWYKFMMLHKYLAGVLILQPQLTSPLTFTQSFTDNQDLIKRLATDQKLIRLFSGAGVMSNPSLNWGQKLLWYLGIKCTSSAEINSALTFLQHFSRFVLISLGQLWHKDLEKMGEYVEDSRLTCLSRFKVSFDKYNVPLPVVLNGIRPPLQTYYR